MTTESGMTDAEIDRFCAQVATERLKPGTQRKRLVVTLRALQSRIATLEVALKDLYPMAQKYAVIDGSGTIRSQATEKLRRAAQAMTQEPPR